MAENIAEFNQCPFRIGPGQFHDMAGEDLPVAMARLVPNEQVIIDLILTK